MYSYLWGIVSWCLPGFTTLRFNTAVRRSYIHKIQNNNGLELLGVQTMRNLIMGASLMATLSEVLGVGLLSFSSNKSCDGSASDMTCIKLIVLSVVFMIAGLLFIWATRAAVHVSILISLRPADFEKMLSSPATTTPKPNKKKEGKERHSSEEEDIEAGVNSGSDYETEDGDEADSAQLSTPASRKELRRLKRGDAKMRKKKKIYARVTASAERFISHFTLYFHLVCSLSLLCSPF